MERVISGLDGDPRKSPRTLGHAARTRVADPLGEGDTGEAEGDTDAVALAWDAEAEGEGECEGWRVSGTRGSRERGRGAWGEGGQGSSRVVLEHAASGTSEGARTG
jgi:hypothetical protein